MKAPERRRGREEQTDGGTERRRESGKEGRRDGEREEQSERGREGGREVLRVPTMMRGEECGMWKFHSGTDKHQHSAITASTLNVNVSHTRQHG